LAARHIGAGERGGLVIAVALAGWWASRSPMSSGRMLASWGGAPGSGDRGDTARADV